MKTSISVPDELWDCVKDAADGPSAVVQHALTLLCENRSDPLAHAPSTDLKARVSEAMTAQIERIAGSARKLSEEGYEMGVALASHLSLVQLLALPASVAGVEGRLGDVWDGGQDYLEAPSAFEDLSAWTSHWNPEVGLLLKAEDFWRHADLVLERHVEAAPDASFDESNGRRTLWFGELGEFAWFEHDTPEGWWVPDPNPELGEYFILEGRLPAPYLRGIAGALVDLRNAVAARSGPTLAAPDQRDSSGEARS